jgi:anti-sigma factor (TIGR02949 family)
VLLMPSCREIDPLVTPYIDGEATDTERAMVNAHLAGCPPCRSRAEAEADARQVLRSRGCQPCAPEKLRNRCRKVASPLGRITYIYSPVSLSVFAAAFLMAGGVSVYGLTRLSPTVLAAQLTLDHVKCFAVHPSTAVLDAHASEDQFARDYGWRLHVPMAPAADGLQLVGVRRCFCGEGPAVHVMYRHDGEPISLYVLPHVTRPSATADVFGRDAVIWSENDTTFVLLGKQPPALMRQLAADLN